MSTGTFRKREEKRTKERKYQMLLKIDKFILDTKYNLLKNILKI